ncbi:TA2R9 protein, partial [Upupa epops]|nr:TA2R9 protein [Upupa epops]
DKFNATSYDDITVVIISLQTFAGMWINTFIVSVLGLAWVRKKSFNSNEKILFFLGCSRFCYFSNLWAYFFLLIKYPWCFYVQPIPQLLSAVHNFFNASNTWASACLCVFYCIKIANFRHIVFTFLKAKIDRIVPGLLLVSVLVSLIVSILCYDITDRALVGNLSSNIEGNLWVRITKMDNHYFIIFFINGFLFAAAFTAAILSALLLLFSLWRHKCRMQTNSVKDFSMEAHIRAMKSILTFIVVYTINFIYLVLSLIYASEKNITVIFLVLIFQYALPALHSLILIFSNPKLEETLLRTLTCVKCKVCLRQEPE